MKPVRSFIGSVGVVAVVGGAAIGTPLAAAGDTPEKSSTPDNVLDLVAVGDQRALPSGEVSAARITDTPAGREVMESIDVSEMLPGRSSSQSALNAFISSLEVYRFGSGDRQVTLTIPADADFLVLEGRNSAGEMIYDIAVSGGAVSPNEFVAATGGRSVQAAPPHPDSFSSYHYFIWETTVGNHFTRISKQQFFQAFTKSGRRFLRAFLTSSGGEVLNGSGLSMRSMWVQLDRKTGWGAAPVWSDLPQPTTSGTGGPDETCKTRGWGTEVGAALKFPPVEFSAKVSSSMTVQTCGPNETYDPIYLPLVGNHGMIWNRYGSNPPGIPARQVVTSVVVDIPKGKAATGWHGLTGQSSANND